MAALFLRCWASPFLACLINRTTFGLWLRAIGGNERASEVIGVPVRPMIVAALAASGAFAGSGWRN